MNTCDLNEVISDLSKFYILILLHDKPLHGYRILSEFKKRVGKDISPSLVYPFLQEIEKRGLATSNEIREAKRKRKVYTLTRKGREVCRRFLKQFSVLISTAIEPSLEVCAHCGCKVYEGGYHEFIDGKETMFCCKSCADSYNELLSGKREISKRF